MTTEKKEQMNIYEKLLKIQNELKAPKNQYNKFGNYKYRNAEDILEAVKPICLKYKAVINVCDTIVQVGDRYYVEANAVITDIEKPGDYIENKASAREEENKKGMDSSQVTGATSSYARKYALNGLLCIDDTKDTDSEEYQKKGTTSTKTTTKAPSKTTKDYKQALLDKLKELKVDVSSYAKEHKLSAKTTQDEAKTLLEKLEKGEVA